MKRLVLWLTLCVFFCAPVLAQETISLTVWGPRGDQEILASLIKDFQQEHPENLYDITLEAVEEPDVWERYLEDPNVLPDIFAFVNSRFISLASDGVLLPIVENYETVVAENTATAVSSATLNGALYAYPTTEDDGYFLYYDRSVLTAEDVKTLEGILAKAEATGKRVFMDVSNGWYLASFFFGAGCSLGIDENGRQTCDFNSEAGIAAGEAIRAFTAHPAFLPGDDATLVAGMGETICAGVSGTWNAEMIRKKLGDRYGACKLPTYSLMGRQVPMGTFLGSKLIGVSVATDFPQDAGELALFLSNERAQILRFKVRAMGPSNLKAASNPEVQANAALAALLDEDAYGISPKLVLESYWAPAEAFGLAMESHSQEDMRTLLNALVAAVEGA
jgi:arabinogalactan oligomer/maltooligosaccharide transport system substrate-binding protein